MNLGSLFPLFALSLAGALAASGQTNPPAETQTNLTDTASVTNRIAKVTGDVQAASARVRQIVNQPVTRLPRTRGMEVWTSKEGWFHAGAGKPDYETVDIRKTQELPYAKMKYITSDLNPGVVFVGAELEFNSMTKIFYTDRSVPKKKLTEAEMLEINRLYRVIGRGLKELAELQKKP